MGDFLAAIGAGFIVSIIMLPFEFLSSLYLAGFLVLMFNLSGILALSSVPYWSLVWIVLGAIWVVGSGCTYAKIATDALG